jgi:hypothetical protein
MPQFEYEINIHAASEEEAQRKVTAGSALLNILSIAELEKLAYIAQHDPQKRQMARTFLGV